MRVDIQRAWRVNDDVVADIVALDVNMDRHIAHLLVALADMLVYLFDRH